MSLSAQAETIEAALGQLLKGVYLFTLRDEAGCALTPGTALINFGAAPPTLLWSLETRSSFYPRLLPGVAVTVNVLAAGQQKLLRDCAAASGAARFEYGVWREPALTGFALAPCLDDAAAVLGCRVRQVWRDGAQGAVVLEIVAGGAGSSSPLGYAGGGFAAWPGGGHR